MTCGVMGGKDWDEHLPDFDKPKPTTPEYTGIGYILEDYSRCIIINTRDWYIPEPTCNE